MSYGSSKKLMTAVEKNLQNQVDTAEKRIIAIEARSKGLDNEIEMNKSIGAKKDAKRAKEVEKTNKEF